MRMPVSGAQNVSAHVALSWRHFAARRGQNLEKINCLEHSPWDIFTSTSVLLDQFWEYFKEAVFPSSGKIHTV